MKILGIDIQVLGHASTRITNRHTIYIDPFQLPDEAQSHKADIILISHSHYDHCSPKDVEKIATDKTIIITTPDCQSSLSRLNVNVKEVILVEPGKTVEAMDVKVTATAAYNIAKAFHPKQNDWVGFVVEVDGVKVYHAADTDLIPEMKQIDCDIALLPVSGTYTMTAREAAQATKIFKRVKIAIPMHYGTIIGTASDAEEFKNYAGCEVKILM